MKIKKIIIFIGLMCVFFAFVPNQVNADVAMSSVINKMSGVGNGDAKNNGIGKIINGFIQLVQIAGSAISVLMVTIMGAKYMLASSNDKADVKKQMMPMLIGCVLLFAASNIVKIIADIGVNINSN